MRRGERRIFAITRAIGAVVSRSSDGEWRDGDKPLRWFEFIVRHRAEGWRLDIIIGEYAFSVMQFRSLATEHPHKLNRGDSDADR